MKIYGIFIILFVVFLVIVGIFLNSKQGYDLSVVPENLDLVTITKLEAIPQSNVITWFLKRTTVVDIFLEGEIRIPQNCVQRLGQLHVGTRWVKGRENTTELARANAEIYIFPIFDISGERALGPLRGSCDFSGGDLSKVEKFTLQASEKIKDGCFDVIAGDKKTSFCVDPVMAF